MAHEESFLRRTPSAAPTLLHLQNQVTSSKLVKLGAPLGLHYSQAVWVRPCGVYPFLMSLAYLAGGAPRAALSPSRSGLTQWHVSPMHLLKTATLIFNLPIITTWSIVASHGASSRRHGAGARVRACHVDKPKRPSSGSRHAPRTSPHQALSAFISSWRNRRQTGHHNGKLCLSLCWLAGIS